MSKKSDEWRINEAERRNEFLKELIEDKDFPLSPERQEDYENEINGNDNFISIQINTPVEPENKEDVESSEDKEDEN